ncbi:MAG: GNAT family N-acetyltransferase [Proteobacteria bacterium]|nr:GNAT family N-acetyltransferase [Pseudomonadota bacterium]MCZ6785033.1 GNAT family N-acetyltransferase [Pseudomonadota bacterium]
MRVESIPRGSAGAVEVLARAFRDNPLNVAVVGTGPERRLRSNRHGMRSLLESAADRALILGGRLESASRDLGPPAGVLVAAAPSTHPLPPASPWTQLRCLAGQGLRTIRRWGQVYRALEAVHPLEPHWYLAVLGVDPSHQRLGWGRALLQSFLERVDADPSPGYLETDREENVAFYAAAGFERKQELSVLGVPVWCMWRPTR